MIDKRALFAILLLFIVSCSGGKSEITEQDIYSGTRGLSISFIDGSIPDELFEEEEFDLVLDYTNYGAYPVEGNILLMVEKGYMEFGDGDHLNLDSISLDGKDNFMKYDDREVRSYSVKAKEIDELSQSHDVSIMIAACYDYQTKAHADVCIDTDPNDVKNSDKVCSAVPVSMSGGQGAPVAVTKVEPTMLNQGDQVKPRFTITISNQDSGTVIKKGATDKACSGEGMDRDDYGIVELQELRFSQYDLGDFDCFPDELKLDDDTVEFVCKLKESIGKDVLSYMTPLYIELEYGYMFTDSRSVVINNDQV